MDAHCSSCRWFCRLEDRATSGECRCNPPQLLIGNEDPMQGVWPIISEDDWCGRHTPVKSLVEAQAPEH